MEGLSIQQSLLTQSFTRKAISVTNYGRHCYFKLYNPCEVTFYSVLKVSVFDTLIGLADLIYKRWGQKIGTSMLSYTHLGLVLGRRKGEHGRV